jgi:hypothetical protein
MSCVLSLEKLLTAGFICLSETLLELGYSATGIKNSLLTCIEGMANGTNFNVDRTILLCTAGSENFTATTSYFGLYILWVNLVLHISP